MKNLIDLFKRKKYKAVAISMSFIVCAIIFWIPFIFELFTGFGLDSKYLSTIIVLPFISIGLIWCGLSFYPSTCGYNLDKEDFEVKYVEGGVEVKYKQYRFILKNGQSSINYFPSVDEDGNEVPRRLATQLSEAFGLYFKRFREHIVPEESKTVKNKSEKEVSKIPDTVKMTSEEKEKLIRKRKPLGLFTLIISFVLICVGIFCFSYVDDNAKNMTELEIVLIGVVASITSFVTGVVYFIKSFKDLSYKWRVRNGEVYITDCYIYGKIIKWPRKLRYLESYYLKVKTNSEIYVTDWIKTSKKLYKDSSEGKRYKLIIIKYDYKTKFDVQPIEMFEDSVINY